MQGSLCAHTQKASVSGGVGALMFWLMRTVASVALLRHCFQGTASCTIAGVASLRTAFAYLVGQLSAKLALWSTPTRRTARLASRQRPYRDGSKARLKALSLRLATCFSAVTVVVTGSLE
jgi:hypothetical protein